MSFQYSFKLVSYFLERQKQYLRATGYNLYLKEMDNKPKKQGAVSEFAKSWKSLPQETKNNFSARAQINKELAIDNLLDEYLTEQQYAAHYGNNFGKVNSHVKKLYTDCLNIKGWFNAQDKIMYIENTTSLQPF